jgi:thymidylate synthase
MKQYLDAVREVLQQGTRKENRTGVDTLSTFNITYEIDLRDGFPLLTTKQISWKNIVVENLWFLSGDPQIGLLRKHGCKFWDAWANEDGSVPSAYGNFWRRFPVPGPSIPIRTMSTIPEETTGEASVVEYNDQLAWVLAELKRNPMSRRLVVSAWAPGNAQTSKLPPCHLLFTFNVQSMRKGPNRDLLLTPEQERNLTPEERAFNFEQVLCLHLTQRSCDIAIGVPYNIAGYAFLLELFARFSGIRAGIFAHTLIDAHAYTSKPDGSMTEYDHVPGLELQLTRAPRRLPRLVIDDGIRDLADIRPLLEAPTDDLLKHFALEGYDPHPAISFKVAV